MGVGVDGFRLGRGPEELGHLLVPFFLGFLGKGQIPAVGLGFTRKGLFQILFCLRTGQCHFTDLLDKFSPRVKKTFSASSGRKAEKVDSAFIPSGISLLLLGCDVRNILHDGI
jgi:hypothetical protein